ncbi:MAG TPA: hypothetical protein VEH48_01105 [Candidatus Nitrosopolaris sp.]|nr:hypothetical protein [Candidatus Nitrosopolaris sp.]
MARRLKSKYAIPGVILLVIVGLIVLVVRSLSAPAVGSVSQTPPSQSQPTVPYNQPGTYKGQYVSFSYPAHYRPTPTGLSGSYLETVVYSSTDQSQKKIDVGISKGSPSTDGSVIYRQQHPELYRENTSAIWLEFIKLDGTEDTFFLQHGNLEASVSVSSPYGDLGSDALYVASSLRWR